MNMTESRGDKVTAKLSHLLYEQAVTAPHFAKFAREVANINEIIFIAPLT